MEKVKMLGALVGDIIGSMYEWFGTKRTDFELFVEGSRFTDDSVMTLAVCQGSVPEAIIAFLEGNSFEEVIRLAISLGGDSDTIGCMAGAIAACMYPIPKEMAEKCDSLLTDDLRDIKDRFLDSL